MHLLICSLSLTLSITCASHAVELLRSGESAWLPLQRLVQPLATGQPRFRADVVLCRLRGARRSHQNRGSAPWRTRDEPVAGALRKSAGYNGDPVPVGSYSVPVTSVVHVRQPKALYSQDAGILWRKNSDLIVSFFYTLKTLNMLRC